MTGKNILHILAPHYIAPVLQSDYSNSSWFSCKVVTFCKHRVSHSDTYHKLLIEKMFYMVLDPLNSKAKLFDKLNLDTIRLLLIFFYWHIVLSSIRLKSSFILKFSISVTFAQFNFLARTARRDKMFYDNCFKIKRNCSRPCHVMAYITRVTSGKLKNFGGIKHFKKGFKQLIWKDDTMQKELVYIT